MPLAVDHPEPVPPGAPAGDRDDLFAVADDGAKGRSARRAPGHWLVIAVGLGVLLVMGALVAAVAQPTRAAKIPLANQLVHELSVDALVVAVAGLAFGLWMLLRASRVLGAMVSVMAAIAVVAVLVPIVALSRTAAESGTTMSILATARHVGNSAVPDDSRSVTYTQVDGRSLLLDAWPAVAPGNRAAVVWVHDGGWVSGIRSSTPRLDEWLTQHGFAVFDIDYRLAPQARNDQAAADVRCAVSWVKGHAARYGIDADRVIVAGASSGGQLALRAAYDPTGPSSCAAADVGDASVAAVMALYPATDLASLYQADTFDGKMRDWLRKTLGGDPNQLPDAYRAASPLDHVNAGVPPTLLVHGGQDAAIPASQTDVLATALQRAGVDHRAVILPFTDHAFDHSWNAPGTQIDRQLLVDFANAHLPR